MDNEDIALANVSDSPSRKTLHVGQIVDLLGMGRFTALLFVVCGLGFCGDAFELLVLSFVLPNFVKEWGLSLTEQATVTCMGFCGWLAGSVVWGVLADAFGRRKTYVAVLASLVGVGLLQLSIVNFPLLLLMRFLMGFAIGGVFTAYALLAEFLPTKYRIIMLSIFQAWFAVGSVFGAGLALVVLDKSWRLLVGLVRSIDCCCFVALALNNRV